MSRLARSAVIALLMASASVASAADVWVRIVSPKNGDFAIGEVEFVAEVVAAEPVASVEFRVDGRTVGTLSIEPYRLSVDLGAENRSHVFEVIARAEAGGEATDRVETQAVPIAREIEVELQQLYVTVSKDSQRVLDLRPEDFTIRDDGAEQKLVTFALGDIPFTAVLLIDASASMAGDKLQAAMAGATAFVGGMQELDQAKVMVFSDRLLNTTPFSNVQEVITASLATAHAAGGTALHDYLYVALKLLEQRQGRRVVVLLSDGVDSHSALSMQDVAERARRSQALIYWIRLRRAGSAEADDEAVRLSSAWRDPGEYRNQFELLKQTVLQSGGSISSIRSIDQIQPVFLGILQELREQYVLGYYPSNRRNDGAWHSVDVKVDRGGVDVRVGEGYIDF